MTYGAIRPVETQSWKWKVSEDVKNDYMFFLNKINEKESSHLGYEYGRISALYLENGAPYRNQWRRCAEEIEERAKAAKPFEVQNFAWLRIFASVLRASNPRVREANVAKLWFSKEKLLEKMRESPSVQFDVHAIKGLSLFECGEEFRDSSSQSYNPSRIKETYETAIADFDVVLKIEPTFAEALAFRGISRARLAQLREGESDLEEALKLKPKLQIRRTRNERARGLTDNLCS